MAELPFGRSDYFRGVAKEARIITRNRYFEENPVLTTQTATAMIARPGQRRWLYVGDGPIRPNVYSQPGSFDDALFVVSDTVLFRVDRDGTITQLQTGLLAGGGAISMVATGTIGETPEYLFIADGRNLYLYVENGYAKGQISGTPANTDVVRVGSVYYKFTNASVNAGAPAGTIANPWLVALGANSTDAWQNFKDALGNEGLPGTQYSTALTSNTEVIATNNSSTTVIVRATALGILGNGVVTTETGAGIAWGAGTLTGGGSPSTSVVQTPDDVGIISLGYSASYVVCVPAQGEGINGRFLWIEPGETTIDPSNFATAESAPDPIYNVIVFGDQFWLPGSNTTEVWYFTGNLDAPVLRLKGVSFNRGTWQGTAVQIKESMIIVDSDGGVFQISGGLERISRPDIEERIRESIAYQAFRLL